MSTLRLARPRAHQSGRGDQPTHGDARRAVVPRVSGLGDFGEAERGESRMILDQLDSRL